MLNDFYEFRFEPVAIPPPTLIDDMRSLIDHKDFSDVTFIVEGRPVYASRAHLAVRSEHFRAMLYGGMRESSSGEITIPDVSVNVFLKVLEYLYTDSVIDIPPELAVPLLIAAEQYLLDRLKVNGLPAAEGLRARRPTPRDDAFPAWNVCMRCDLQGICEDRIHKSITADNVISIFMAAHRHRANGLKEICLDFILENLEAVKLSKGFQELTQEPELLMAIVMRAGAA